MVGGFVVKGNDVLVMLFDLLHFGFLLFCLVDGDAAGVVEAATVCAPRLGA